MEHPLIPNLDSLTTQQITDKISELNKRNLKLITKNRDMNMDIVKLKKENKKLKQKLNNYIIY